MRDTLPAMIRPALLAALPLLLALPATAQEAEPPTPASIVEASDPEEWVAIAPDDLLVMDLAPDANGRARQVVIQLMPAPFSQPWVANVRTLARAHWWDGTSVYRVVDNWVAQWGAGEDEDAGFVPRPLPAGVVSPVAPYLAFATANAPGIMPMTKPEFTPFQFASDPYVNDGNIANPLASRSGMVGWSEGWPVGLMPSNPRGPDESLRSDVTGRAVADIWPIHCYAHVGVARDLAPDTGTGAELYAVIGHAPRQLDRNIAVVGRVISGIEHLSTLPRGTGEAGVYEDRAEDTPIVSVRLGSDLPEAPQFEYLGTQSESFARYVASRANRSDAFYTVPAGGVDICNVQVPVRPAAL